MTSRPTRSAALLVTQSKAAHLSQPIPLPEPHGLQVLLTCCADFSPSTTRCSALLQSRFLSTSITLQAVALQPQPPWHPELPGAVPCAPALLHPSNQRPQSVVSPEHRIPQSAASTRLLIQSAANQPQAALHKAIRCHHHVLCRMHPCDGGSEVVWRCWGMHSSSGR